MLSSNTKCISSNIRRQTCFYCLLYLRCVGIICQFYTHIVTFKHSIQQKHDVKLRVNSQLRSKIFVYEDVGIPDFCTSPTRIFNVILNIWQARFLIHWLGLGQNPLNHISRIESIDEQSPSLSLRTKR